ncbi:MAG: DedA family protein [Frankiaceae bacterium]
MSGFVEQLLHVDAALIYGLVALLVFAEDAVFVGFLVPGETAAVLGGVAASRGQVHLGLMIAVVVAAAIIGDTVGYEVGRLLGPRILRVQLLEKRRKRLEAAQDFLRQRGGWAVLLGRFVAFFRAVMPALAGTSRMPYRRFLVFNAAGGLIWGGGFVLLGYLAGNSYHTVERVIGRGSAVAVVALLLVAIAVWRVRKHRSETAGGGAGRRR